MDINAKNVGILIRFMDGLNDPRFDMRDYFHGCGTPSCALGWASTIPEFAKLRYRDGPPTHMSNDVFGRDAYFSLFNGLRHAHIKTPQQWADHARAVLKENGLEVPLPEQKFSAFMEKALKPVPLPKEITA